MATSRRDKPEDKSEAEETSVDLTMTLDEPAKPEAAPVSALTRFDPKAPSFHVEGFGVDPQGVDVGTILDPGGHDVSFTWRGVTYRHVSEVSGTDAAGSFDRWVYRAQAS